MTDAAGLNTKHTNYPIDLIAGDNVIEVKTGIVSNGPSAQQWRATIGQPGKAEAARIKSASPELKKEWNLKKQKDILDRKAAAKAEIEAQTGRKLTAKTITTILNPDTKTADIYEFDGFHSRIAWNSPEAKRAYRGTFDYS